MGARRRRSRFEDWAWSPVIVLRVSLVATYALYVYAGIIAFIAGIPIFTLTTPEGYTSLWAALLIPAAAVAFFGALHDRWEKVEQWAAAALSSLLLGYAGGLNIVGFILRDLDRQFIGAVALIAMVLPVARFVYLAAQGGKRRVHDR